MRYRCTATGASGVQFDECYHERFDVTIEGLTVPFISLDKLIMNKAATGRAKDLADIEELSRKRK